ncbi:MAG: hypothetical protein ABIQ95_08190, partial [Bdellovibrionia bacterium]
LNGCIAQMQNASRNIKVDRKNLDSMRKNYILAGNQSTEKNARNVAAMLSPQVNNINHRLQQMGITIPPIRGEKLEFDQDGLAMPPTNALTYVGQFSAPPMPDMNDGAMSEAVRNSEESQREANRQLSKLQSDKYMLQNMMANCQQNGNSGQALTSSLSMSQRHANELSMANCGTVLGVDKCLERHMELMKQMGEIVGDNHTHTQSIQGLHTNIDAMCSSNKTGPLPPSQADRMRCELAYNKLKSSLTSTGSASARSGTSSGNANFGGGMMGGGMYGGGMMGGGMYGGGMYGGGMYPGQTMH